MINLYPFGANNVKTQEQIIVSYTTTLYVSSKDIQDDSWVAKEILWRFFLISLIWNNKQKINAYTIKFDKEQKIEGIRDTTELKAD